MFQKHLIKILYFLLFAHHLIAQPNAHFKMFEGVVYNIPYRIDNPDPTSKMKYINVYDKGYGDHVYEYDQIKEISWEKINVSDRSTDESFRDIPKTQLFGIVFHSSMMIPEAACYEFSINSDDGSRFWIEEQEVINNDGGHRMKMKKDSVYLDKGEYKIKLWYYQGLPTQYGFEFESKNIGSACEAKLEPKKEIEKFTLQSSMLFDKNQFQLNGTARESLDSIVQIISNKTIKRISIYGHTDDTGSEEYNLKLSGKRSNVVKQYLETIINNKEILFTVKAMGESNPLVENNSIENRAINRRVEIVIE